MRNSIGTITVFLFLLLNAEGTTICIAHEQAISKGTAFCEIDDPTFDLVPQVQFVDGGVAFAREMARRYEESARTAAGIFTESSASICMFWQR